MGMLTLRKIRSDIFWSLFSFLLQAKEIAEREAAQIAKRRQIDEEAAELARQAAEEAEQKIAAGKGDEEAAAALKAKAEAEGEAPMGIHLF